MSNFNHSQFPITRTIHIPAYKYEVPGREPLTCKTTLTWGACLNFGREYARLGYAPEQLLSHIAGQIGETWEAAFWDGLRHEFEKSHINYLNRNNPNWIA